MSYFALATLLTDNWKDIKAHTLSQRLSASRPHLMKNSPRAVVPRYKFGELPRLRGLRRRGTRYVLKTDINQFYPSLYTHTIPWALHTKPFCKAQLSTPGKGSHLLGSKIDKAFQCVNEGQTHGIPIGPDASLVAAEILLTAVDAELLKRCKDQVRGFRYVDDYELSFLTLAHGEAVLAELQSILAEFELTLNPRKTQIGELPFPSTDGWATRLGKFEIRDSSMPTAQRNDVVAFFSLASELARELPEEPILKYAVSHVQNLKIAPSAWRAFQNCVLGAATADASSLPIVIGTLYQTAAASGQPISKAPLGETFEYIVSRHAKRGEGSEVAWALWGALAWSISMGKATAEATSRMEDNVVALLALDAESNGLFPPNTLDKTSWSQAVNQAGALHGPNWLLTYEANQHKWLLSPEINADSVFSAMSKAGVAFYDSSKNVPQFPAGARGNPGGSLQNFYA